MSAESKGEKRMNNHGRPYGDTLDIRIEKSS